MISGRLRRAGRQEELFTPGAVQLIHQRTGGLPRKVIVLCLASMWAAYEEGSRIITVDEVRTAVERYSNSNVLGMSVGQGAQTAVGWPIQPLASSSRLTGLLHRLKQFMGYSKHFQAK
jgi:hypothetical protein